MRTNMVFFSMLLCIFSCTQKNGNTKTQKEISEDTITPANPQVKIGQTKIILSEPSQKITVASNKITKAVGKKGIRITVDPSALETVNGAPLGVEIEIELKEITNQEELFKNDAPTACYGRLLVSGGAYYIGMTSNGNTLKVKAGKSVSIQLPEISANEMELFYGERDSSGNLNWITAGKKIIPQKNLKEVKTEIVTTKKVETVPTKDTTREMSDLEKLLNYADQKGGRMSAAEFKSMANTGKIADNDGADFSTRVTEITDTATGKKVKEIKTLYYNPVEITSLGWINCDRFYNNPNKSEIECEFDSSFNITSAAIYVVFKNMNAMQKEYVAKATPASLMKLINQYPAGEAVKLIAITNIGGKFYESKQELVLQSKERVRLKFSPVNDIALIKSNYRF